MTFFHAYLNGSTTGPIVFNDEAVLNQWLSSQASGSVVNVHRYDTIRSHSEFTYGVLGGREFPNPPLNPIETESVTITHIWRKGKNIS